MNKQEIIKTVLKIVEDAYRKGLRDGRSLDNISPYLVTSQVAAYELCDKFISSLTTPKSEVSAEEVLDAHLPHTYLSERLKEKVIRAMHDYSAQSNVTEPQVDKVTTEKIDIRRFNIDGFGEICDDNNGEYVYYKDAINTTQSNAEAMREHAIDEAFIEWYVTNVFYRNSDGFHRSGNRVGEKYIIEELYNEYLTL